MKFSEAMDLLKSGLKVTRNSWKENVYFKIVGTVVKSFQPKLSPYLFNEDIMISDGWLLADNWINSKEYKFCDIILFLQEGSQAKLRDWDDIFIYLDKDTGMLVLYSMEVFPFIPDFQSFVAEDWIELK